MIKDCRSCDTATHMIRCESASRNHDLETPRCRSVEGRQASSLNRDKVKHWTIILHGMCNTDDSRHHKSYLPRSSDGLSLILGWQYWWLGLCQDRVPAKCTHDVSAINRRNIMSTLCGHAISRCSTIVLLTKSYAERSVGKLCMTPSSCIARSFIVPKWYPRVRAEVL